MDRRQFHRWARAAAWSLALAPWQEPTWAQTASERNWKTAPFQLGVASGSVRHDSVVIWTRLLVSDEDRQALAGDGLSGRYEIYADESLRRLVQRGEWRTDATRAHSVHVAVSGLLPARSYWYRFVCGDAISPVGRTQTAPSSDAEVARLRLALASCQHFEHGQYVAHRDMARQDLDLVVFVGDYIYENSNPRNRVRSHRGPEPKTLTEYRDHYAQYKSDPDLQASHAAHPWLLMWDDHEVVNDYANQTDPARTDPAVFLARRAAAYRAYFEHQPVRLGPDPASPYAASMRLHSRLHWGRLADLWTLDCRQYRDPQACPDPVRGGGRVVLQCAELSQPQRSMLGADQEQWLYAGLQRSQRQWKLLAQSTIISSTRIDSPLGKITYTDGWDGYPMARRRLIDAIGEARLNDVVTLGGDVHMNVASVLRPEPNDTHSAPVASEFVTTSISSRGMADSLLSAIKGSNPDLMHARSDERGYTLLDFNAKQATVEFRNTPHSAGTSDLLKVQARFAVESGRVGPQAA
ncbi:MAG: alkaline phosphatase D family protein [Alphaproteobacteria bacterium]|nr:alkaline phosphatase D family protein [Alphaproteobacteria bacterium]